MFYIRTIKELKNRISFLESKASKAADSVHELKGRLDRAEFEADCPPKFTVGKSGAKGDILPDKMLVEVKSKMRGIGLFGEVVRCGFYWTYTMFDTEKKVIETFTESELEDLIKSLYA